MSDMAMPPDLSSLQEQLAALQAESDMNTQGKVKGFLQQGLTDPSAKYNYTEQLGGDVIDYMLESGIDLKKVSMEVAMAKLDEMMSAQEQIVQQLNEYARQHKREINDAIRQAEDAQDELSAMRQVIQKVESGSAETASTDSVDDLAPPDAAAGAPMEGGMPMEGGGGMPPAGADLGVPSVPPDGGAVDLAAGGATLSPAPVAGDAGGIPAPPQPPQPYAKGGYVNSPRYNALKAALQKKRGVVSDQNVKVVKPSKAILAGVLGGI
jgi:hypothetical protein